MKLKFNTNSFSKCHKLHQFLICIIHIATISIIKKSTYSSSFLKKVGLLYRKVGDGIAGTQAASNFYPKPEPHGNNAAPQNWSFPNLTVVIINIKILSRLFFFTKIQNQKNYLYKNELGVSKIRHVMSFLKIIFYFFINYFMINYYCNFPISFYSGPCHLLAYSFLLMCRLEEFFSTVIFDVTRKEVPPPLLTPNSEH
jgi:hypothetical protein